MNYGTELYAIAYAKCESGSFFPGWIGWDRFVLMESCFDLSIFSVQTKTEKKRKEGLATKSIPPIQTLPFYVS